MQLVIMKKNVREISDCTANPSEDINPQLKSGSFPRKFPLRKTERFRRQKFSFRTTIKLECHFHQAACRRLTVSAFHIQHHKAHITPIHTPPDTVPQSGSRLSSQLQTSGSLPVCLCTLEGEETISCPRVPEKNKEQTTDDLNYFTSYSADNQQKE